MFLTHAFLAAVLVVDADGGWFVRCLGSGIRSGIVMLRDTRPDEPQQLVNVEVPTEKGMSVLCYGAGVIYSRLCDALLCATAEDPEPSPPEPFDVTD